MLTANWGEFIKGVSARIDEIIDETKDLTPSFMSVGLHKKVMADDIVYRTKGVTGFGYLEKFDEGASINSDETYPAYSTEYNIKSFGKKVDISQLLMKSRPAELEAKLSEVKQLMIATNRSLNKHAWQPLVDGFVTADSSANFPTARLADGVAWYSSAHPSRVSGVANRSNRLASDPLLSRTTLEQATRAIREQLNGRGLPIGYEGRFLLVVPPALEKLAVELTQSELAPGLTDNDINYYKGRVSVVSSVYLGAANGGSDTAWYVFALDSGEQAPLRFVELIAPKIEKQVNFNTKTIEVTVDGAWAMGYSNFEYTAASDGTND